MTVCGALWWERPDTGSCSPLTSLCSQITKLPSSQLLENPTVASLADKSVLSAIYTSGLFVLRLYIWNSISIVSNWDFTQLGRQSACRWWSKQWQVIVLPSELYARSLEDEQTSQAFVVQPRHIANEYFHQKMGRPGRAPLAHSIETKLFYCKCHRLAKNIKNILPGWHATNGFKHKPYHVSTSAIEMTSRDLQSQDGSV